MKMYITAMATLALLLTCSGSFGAECKEVKLNIEPPQLRHWPDINAHDETRPRVSSGMLGQGDRFQFPGTLEDCTTYRAHIKDPATGRIYEIPLYYLSVLDLSYIETRLALNNLPETIRDWTIDAGDKSRNTLIDIDAADLPLGEFKEMENKGMLGGKIINANRPPLIEMVDGRKAITFQKEHRPGHKYPNYQMLTGTFTLRERLDKNKPFTMSAWIYTEDSDDGGLMSWHSIGGDHGTRLSFPQHSSVGGMGGDVSRQNSSGNVTNSTGLKCAARWQHVAYVYTGGEDGEFRVYSDGEVVSRVRYDNVVNLRPVLEKDIGTTNVTIRCDLLSKAGEAAVVCYMGEVDHKNWQQIRWYNWPLVSNGGTHKQGEVQFELNKLKPGTRYYYRIMAADVGLSSWNYAWQPSHRWSYGPGSFVTASEDGKPGENVPEDTRKHFFIGADWGAHWYYANSGPCKWFRGSIGSMKLFDYAMDDLEVLGAAGLTTACNPAPEDDAALDSERTDLAWRAADAKAAQYNVYISTKQDEVEQGSVTPINTKTARIQKQEMAPGNRYFWRVDQLDKQGKLLTTGKTWTFRSIIGEAREPSPEPGEAVSPMSTLSWTAPPKSVKGVNFYMAASEEKLAAMTKPTQFLKGDARSFNLPGKEMVQGRTYYWRADVIQEDGHLTPGPVWHFTVQPYFTPERDVVSQEPIPDEAGEEWGVKMMEESTGHPAVGFADLPEAHMRAKVHGTARMLGKSRILAMFLEANNNGTTLNGKGWGAGLVNGCSYGSGSSAHSDLLFHEMGHQVFGILQHTVPGYNATIERNWLAHIDDNVGMGGYNTQNTHEDMAVNCHSFLYANSQDQMHRLNYQQFASIKEHVPGELYIDLNATRGVTTDGDGVVRSWANSGGFEHWTSDAFEKTEGTVGTFVAHGDPKLGTIDGVTCVILDGDDALEWDLKTKWALHRNRDFAVEFWALKSEQGAPGQVLAAWGGETNPSTGLRAGGTRFLWGSDDAAYRHSGNITGTWGEKPGLGKWQHIVQLYRGGRDGVDAGPYEVYVNNKRVHEGTHLFDLGSNARVYVGGLVNDGKVSNGFKGALAHVRIYDYDLSEYQIDNHYAEEVPAYQRDKLEVADKLYVDMDARYFADTPQLDHRPVYPEKLRKPWLRSWANHGTLGGRVHNDIHTAMWGYSGSRPRLRENMGTLMPTFTGLDRMVSGFEPDAELLAKPPRTLELWLDNQAENDDEVILEWGEFQLTAQGLPQGRQCVSIVFDEAKGTVYVNGKKIEKHVGGLAPMDGQRLHLGGHYDVIRWNWKQYFNGTIAALRVHKGALSEAQIKANAGRHIYSPGNSGVVVAKPDLNKAPLFDLNAAKLEKGAVTVWPNKGSAAGAFVAGSRGDIYGLPVQTFKGIAGLRMADNRALESSFEIPEALKKGPFTIYAHVVQTIGWGPAGILSWADGKAKLSYKGNFSCQPAKGRAMTLSSGFSNGKEKSMLGLPFFWRNIAVTCDGKTMKYYTDGVLTGELAGEFLVDETGKMMLGDMKNTNTKVCLNEIKVFSRVLSENEIKSLEPGKSVAQKDCLVAVQAPSLDDDTLVTTLPNRGSLGGSFNALKDVDHTPEATEVAGVPCVSFDGKTQFLLSSDNAPATLTGDHAFTIEMKVYADKTGGTLLAFAPTIGKVSKDGRLGAPGGNAVPGFAWGTEKIEKKWMHLTYVYDGGRRSRIRLFVDGTLVNTYRRRSLASLPGYRMYMASSFDMESGEQDLFQGAIASLKAYDYARTEEQINAAAAK